MLATSLMPKSGELGPNEFPVRVGGFLLQMRWGVR